jgi:hypothetical protein
MTIAQAQDRAIQSGLPVSTASGFNSSVDRVPKSLPVFAGFFDYGTPHVRLFLLVVYAPLFLAEHPSSQSQGGGGNNPTCPQCGDEYTKAQLEMAKMFNIVDYGTTGSGEDLDKLSPWPADPLNQRSYIEIRSCIASEETMAACLDKIPIQSDVEGVGDPRDGVLVVSMGDEISVTGGNTTAAAFDVWCAALGLNMSVGCGGEVNVSIASAVGTITSNGHYYHSMAFVQEQGIARYAALTKQVQAALPNAWVGANFAPQSYLSDPRDGQQYCHSYQGMTFQWVEFFRKGGMSLPWGEDWTWQTPVASQQILGLIIDVFRAGITSYPSTYPSTYPQARSVHMRNDNESNPLSSSPSSPSSSPYAFQRDSSDGYRSIPLPPPPVKRVASSREGDGSIQGPRAPGGARPILMYSMAHSPGNNPINWRRNLYTHMVRLLYGYSRHTHSASTIRIVYYAPR